MAVTYNDYVDDDLIVTALLFSGMSANDVSGLMYKFGGNARKVFESIKDHPTFKQNNRYNNVKDYLDHLGTGNLEKMLAGTVGIREDAVKGAIYKAQQEVGGVATPTLDRVLYWLGQQPDGKAQAFAASIRPQLQETLQRSDSALMTTRTQYKTGQRPPAAPPPAAAPGGVGPPAPAPFTNNAGGGDIPDAPKAGDVRAFDTRIAGPGVKAPAGAPAKPKGTATQTPGAGAGGGATLDTTPALGAGASDQAVRDYVRKHYGQYAWMLDVPDIAAVMRQAAEKGWETEEVVGAFSATDWWKKTEPAARQWLEKKSVDPADARDQINKTTTTFRNQALQLGVNIPEAELRTLAEDSLKFAWDENEQRAALGRYYAYDEKNLLGAAAATSAYLKQAARDWMLPVDDQSIARWTEQVIKGDVTTEWFDTYFAQQAASLYPQLEDPISRGIKVGDWMAPYKTMAAQTLGLNPDDIDLREGKWMRAINQVDEKGGRKAMTLYDWENLLKTDETYGWDKTQAGRDHGAEMARSIASQFGFASGGRGM